LRKVSPPFRLLLYSSPIRRSLNHTHQSFRSDSMLFRYLRIATLSKRWLSLSESVSIKRLKSGDCISQASAASIDKSIDAARSA